MGRYDEDGKKHVYYVNGEAYAKSVHGRIDCTGCHVGLDEIPHTDLSPVDCSTKCHIDDPSGGGAFSHQVAVEKYSSSVHGGSASDDAEHNEDLPTCKYCHDNQILSTEAQEWGRSEALSRETLARCVGCHSNEEWAERAYTHLTHRMRRRRSQAEVVRLCTSCHEDDRKMARHGLESIETFKDTFHWVEVKYGVEDAPDCISCHAPVGYSAHDIHPQNDPASPISPENRVQTCANLGGVQSCHPSATEQFARGRVHAYGTKAELATNPEVRIQRDWMKGMTEAQIALLEEEEKRLKAEDLFRFQVISWLKTAYKFLIGMVIGGMSFHQVLDFYRTRKNH